MKISFKISEENYLDFQLYLASESAIVIQKKKWTRKIIPLIYLSIAVVMFFLEKLFLFACFGIIGNLWYFLYPWIEEKNIAKSSQVHFKIKLTMILRLKMIQRISSTLLEGIVLKLP